MELVLYDYLGGPGGIPWGLSAYWSVHYRWNGGARIGANQNSENNFENHEKFGL